MRDGGRGDAEALESRRWSGQCTLAYRMAQLLGGGAPGPLVREPPPPTAPVLLYGGAVRWSAVGNALYDASGRRTRRRGPTRRERTTRRTVSYKASGPDASGMYDASYSVVQGVVQHQHRTTQYDIVRPPSPSRRVNDGSGPSWGKGAFGPLPKYWHFASTTCRQCLQLAGRVYLWCTVSTDPRPPSPCAECCLIEGGGQSVA